MLQLLIRADGHSVSKNPVVTLFSCLSRNLEGASEQATGALRHLTCISEIFCVSLSQGPSFSRFFVVLWSFKVKTSKQATASHFVSHSLKLYLGSTYIVRYSRRKKLYGYRISGYRNNLMLSAEILHEHKKLNRSRRSEKYLLTVYLVYYVRTDYSRIFMSMG
jgi:hypothetical protein